MHIEMTQADESHFPELVDLINSAYRGEGSKEGWTTEADLIDGKRIDVNGLKEMLNQGECTLLIAQDEDEKIHGCAYLKKEGKRCYLGLVTVSPKLQGKGIGRDLLQEAEAFAQFWDCTSMYMKVISIRKELIDWYERQGFEHVREIEPSPFTHGGLGQPKVQGLEFIVLSKNI